MVSNLRNANFSKKCGHTCTVWYTYIAAMCVHKNCCTWDQSDKSGVEMGGGGEGKGEGGRGGII